MEENPFKGDYQPKIGRQAVNIGPVATVVTEDGELTDIQARMVVTKKVDKTPFVKVFVEKFPFELGGSNIRVLMAMISQLDYDSNKVHFSLEVAQSILPTLTRSSYYRSIRTLLQTKCIAKSNTKHTFFISPAIAYKGNRLHQHKNDQ